MIRRLLRRAFGWVQPCPNCRTPTWTGHYVKSWFYEDGYWLCDEIGARRR